MRRNVVIIFIAASVSLFTLPASAMAVSSRTPSTPAATAAQTHTTPQPSSSQADPGSNLASWLKSWVGALFGVIVGAVGLGAVAKRNVGEGLALLLVALIVGGFIIAPDSMNTLTQDVWTKIAG